MNAGPVLYLLGGRSDSEEPLSECSAYDTTSGAWSALPDLPSPLRLHSVCACNGQFAYA